MTRVTGGSVAVAVLVALCCVPALAGQGKAPARYVDKENEFSIELPQGWTVEPSDDINVAMTASSPEKREDGGAKAIIVVSIMVFESKVTLNEAYKEIVEGVSEELQDLKTIDSGPLIVGSEIGKYGTLTCSKEGRMLKGVMVCVVKDKRLAAVFCATAPDFYEDYESIFEHISESFKFETPPSPKPEAVKYTSPDDAFSVVFPDGWTISEPNTESVVVQAMSKSEDVKDTFRENVNVIVMDSPGSPKLDLEAKEFTRLFPKNYNARVVDTAALKIDGRDARRVIYLMSAGLVKLKNTAFIVHCGSRVFVITCNCAEDRFGRYSPVFAKVKDSFSFSDRQDSAAVAATAVDKGTGRWHDKRNGYSIVIPKGWSMSSGFPVGGGLSMEGPSTSGGAPDMLLVIAAQWYTVRPDLDAFSSIMASHMAQKLPTVESTDAGSLTIDGNRAKSLVFSHSANAKRGKTLLICTTQGKLAVMIVFVAPEDRFTANESAVMAAVRSVRFEPVTERLPPIYTDKRYGYSITCPADWAQSEEANTKTFTCPCEGARDDYQKDISVTARRLRKGETLDGCAEDLTRTAKKPEKIAVLKTEPLKLADCDARRILLTGSDGFHAVKDAWYVTIAGDTLYVIKCEAKTDEFERCQSVFESVVKTFKLTGTQSKRME